MGRILITAADDTIKRVQFEHERGGEGGGEGAQRGQVHGGLPLGLSFEARYCGYNI